MPWATEAETLALTGVTVTPPVLAQAQGVIDVFSGVIESAEDEVSARNLRLLRYATAYQAAWMTSQIDVTSRTDVSQLDQDGASFTLGHPDALVLAPLAKRCLDRLSWRGPRARRVRPSGCDRPAFASPEAVQAAFLADGDGFLACWRPAR